MSKVPSQKSKTNFLVRMGSFFFKHAVISTAFWLILIVSSFLVYTTFIKKEGFPSIQFPVTIVNGFYYNEDVQSTDKEIVQPILEKISDLENVESTTSTAYDNNFSIVIEFEDDIIAEEGTQTIQAIINDDSLNLPQQLNINYLTLNPGRFLFKYDVLLSLYATNPDTTIEELQEISQTVSQQLTADAEIQLAEPQNLIETAFNPVSQLEESRQIRLNSLGLAGDNKLNFYSSITIGVVKNEDSNLDSIRFTEHLNQQIVDLDASDEFSLTTDFELTILADFGEIADEQLNSLESNLVTAIIAVMIVSFLLISWRASIITALFMISTILITIGIMFIAGLTLNIITLFSLVLALGLFVDDATIIVEAIEAHKRKNKNKKTIIKKALGKVATASFAGTLTTVLVFVPLLFVTGILGEFIIIMPVTIIIALMSSFILSLILIPVFSKFAILRRTKEDWLTKRNPVTKLEQSIASFLSRRILQLPQRGLINKLFPIMMIIISVFMIITAGNFFSQLKFNIFPAAKDGNSLYYEAIFPDDYNLTQVDTALNEIHQTIDDTLKENVSQVSYLDANTNGAQAYIDLIRYQERDVTSLELVEQLEINLNANISDDNVKIQLRQEGPGGPAAEYPLEVILFTDDESIAQSIIDDIDNNVRNTDLRRSNGTKFKVIDSRPPDLTSISRIDGRQAFILGLQFDAQDISALVQSTTDHIDEEFDATYLKTYNLTTEDLSLDAGSEADNLESFGTLFIIFPVAIVAIYLLLVAQFRSFIRPFLILLAVPFAMFGIGAGLYITDNPLSFFSMLGIISIIGIAVNNTILFTDYMVQELKKGKRITTAAAIATRERFRPLLTTSITTVVALLPLALNDPFWEALSWTIIFGLMSSTFLVIIAFPYYCIIIEYLRKQLWTTRRLRKTMNANQQNID